MAQIVLGPSRAYPNIPTVGDTLESHTNALNQIVEALNIHERRIGGSVLDSFVRVRELETLGLADIDGNIVTDASTEESTTHHHDSTYLRLDGSNDPVTGSVSFSGGLSATGLSASDPIFTGTIDVSAAAWTGLDSNDLADVASIAMLDEAETVTGAWTFDEEIQLTPQAAPAHNEGLLWYDSTEKALSYYNDEADVTINVGQENVIRVRNTTGALIPNGSAVYISGATGANLPNISLAQANALDTSRCIGLATHDIENNSNGYVTTLGLVRDLNTSAYSAGDTLYLSTSVAGGLQNTRPTTGWAVVVGKVTISNVSVGEIKVLSGLTVQRADLTSASQNETVTGAWTFTPRVVLSDGFQLPDSSRYIWNLTGATTWGQYWNTTTNAVEFHAAGAANIILDLDAGSIFTNTDIQLGNQLGDRIGVYGTLDAATSYGIGIEASTMYFKSNSIYRWYVGQNADGGVAHKMALTGSVLDVNVNANFAAGIDVTGNITVTGTVDGVDVAAHAADSDIHVAHSGVTLTAGAGLTGGGTIAASRTFNVGAGTGITVNADDVALSAATIASLALADSALQNVVEDTTPQLGGELQSNGMDIRMAANDAIIFTDGVDNIQFYVDSITGNLEDVATGGFGLIDIDTTVRLNALRFANNDGIYSDNGHHELIQFTGVTSAANYLRVTNSITAAGPILESDGSDANIDLTLKAKGTGIIKLPNYVRITDGGATNYVQFIHNGSNVLVTSVGATNFDMYSGMNFRVWDGTGTLNVQIYHDGTTGKIDTNDDLQLNVNGVLKLGVNSTSDLYFNQQFYVKEQAADDGDYAGYGQFWVRNTAPTLPYFTDDTGLHRHFTNEIAELEYKYDTETLNGVGTAAGEVRFSSATPASVTFMWLSETDYAGRSQTGILNNLVEGDTVLIKQANSDTMYFRARIASVGDSGTYVSFTLTVDAYGTTMPSQDEPVRLCFYPTGSAALPAGTTEDATLTWDNTGGAWVENLILRVDTGTNGVRIYQNGTNDHVEFYHDGNDLLVTNANTATMAFVDLHVELRDVVNLQFGTDGDIRMTWDSVDLEMWANTLTDWTWNIRDGVKLKFWDATDVDSVQFWNDGTDFAISVADGSLVNFELTGFTYFRPTTDIWMGANEKLTFSDGVDTISFYVDSVSGNLEDIATGGFGLIDIDTTVILNTLRFADNDGISSTTGSHELIEFTGVASAVNFLRVTNSITANGPILSADGSDANVDLNLNSKGTGIVKVNGSALFQNLVEDTTPQLGGNLASNGFDILMADNDQVIFGTGSDVVMKWDGTQFRVSGAATNQNFDFIDGMQVRIYDETETSALELGFEAGAAIINNTDTTSITTDIRLNSTTYFRVQDGNGLSGAQVRDANGNLQYVGFNEMPIYEIDVSDTFDKEHAGYMWHKDAGVAVTFTCANDSTIAQGATWVVFNDDTEDLTIAQGTGVTIYWLAGGAAPTAGNVTVSQGGIVTVYKYSDTEFWVWGSKAAGGGGGISNVVEDTTPQLGGNLDTNNFNINLTDSDTINFGTGNDISMKWDGVDFEIEGALAGSNINIRDAMHLFFWDADNSHYAEFQHDGTDFALSLSPTVQFSILGGADIHLLGGGEFRAYNSTSANYITMYHNGTNAYFNTTVGSIVFSDPVTISGALTATSYGGITEANLVDKTATETITGAWDFDGTLTYDLINGPATSSRDKLRVYSSSSYAIGMQSGITFGGIVTEWAMTFQMNDQSTRGFWWGDTTHTTAQGAMALTTDGKLTVANAIRVGYGETDTTVPGGSYDLEVSGTGNFTGALSAASFSGSGSGLTSVPAASIAAGSLVSGVNQYFTASAGNAAYKVPFMNYTGTASTNASMLHDSTASLTYNPSTNTLVAGVFSGSGASLTSIPESAITDGSILARLASAETVSGAWTFSNSISFTGAKITSNQIFINESSAADADVAGDGQIWVKNSAPNQLWFTDDTGQDYPVGTGRYRQFANQSLNMTTASVAQGCINGVWYKTNTTAYTLTLETSSTTNFPVGAQLTIYNAGSSGNLTVVDQTTNTLYYMDGSSVTDVAGSCTIAPGGYATLVRESATITRIMGAGVTA